MTKDWTLIEEDIRLWYCVDRRSLREVRRLAEEKCGFKASVRAYRSKLSEWGCRKVDGKEHNKSSQTSYLSKSLDSGKSIVSTEATLETEPTLSQIFIGSGVADLPPARSDLFDFSGPLNSDEKFLNPLLEPDSFELLAVDLALKQSQLREAVLSGKLVEVTRLLHLGVDVNSVDSAGRTLLLLAGLNCFDDEMIKVLLDCGAVVNTSDRFGRTPVHMSIRSVPTLQILLRFNPDLRRVTVEGNTALHEAVLGLPQTSEAFRILVDHRADLNLPNNAGLTPFHLLLAHPDDFDWAENVQHALKWGANVSQSHFDGGLPIDTFIRRIGLCIHKRWHKWVDILQLFMQKGAQLNGELGSGNKLFQSLFSDSSEMPDYRTMLFFCLHLDPHARGPDGNTALHVLAKHQTHFSSPEPFEVLLSREADPNAENDNAQTPYYLLCVWTSFSSHKSNLWWSLNELFLQAGANPLQNSSGTPPIYELIYHIGSSDESKILRRILAAIVEHSNRYRLWNDMNGYDWWKKYLSYVQRAGDDDWKKADEFLRHNQSPLPRQVNILLRTSARIVLAEFALKTYKARWESSLEYNFLSAFARNTAYRSNYLQTLKGCREGKIAINPEFYQMALDAIE